MEETWKVYTPIARKFEISDSSKEEMTEVEWRGEEPYITPTRKGKKRDKGKGVKRPETPDQPIPIMPQMPSSRKLESDWAKPAETLASEDEPADLGKFIGEHLRNTNGLRDFVDGQERNDVSYNVWCQKHSQHITARQNHTDAAVMSVQKFSMEIKERIELNQKYDEARADKLDGRLSKIEKKLAKIAPVNMAKPIENVMRDCMEKMVEQVTDQVVGKLEKLAEKEKKEEMRRGKQVEVTSETNDGDMSDIEFEPGVTFSEEESRKVVRIFEEMEVEEQELEASKHAPVIPPGEKRQEFTRYTPSGPVTIAKRPVIAPAVPNQKKKGWNELEVKEIPKGPRAGVKKPEVKNPVSQEAAKKPEEKKKETWAQRAAAPPPPSPKKKPEQREQSKSGQQQKKKRDGFVEVKRSQKKKEMKPVFPGQKSMEKRRVTFKRDNGLPASQKKDLDISSEINRVLFEVKVPHFVRVQGITKNTRGCLTAITTPGATAEMLIRYREIVIKAARKVDTGMVDIETNQLWERVIMHRVNFERYLERKTGGGLEKLRAEIQAENEGVVLPLTINWIGGPKDVQQKKAEGKKASLVVFAVKGSKMAEKVLKGGLRAV